VSASSLPEAIFDQLDAATTNPVSCEIRRQGDPTPAVIYEISSCRWDLDISGKPTGTGTASVRVDCVADRALAAWSLAIVCRDALDGVWTQGTYTLVATSLEVAQSRGAPDDGQPDAERVATLSAEFQFKEST
jgi:hypothetical protein